MGQESVSCEIPVNVMKNSAQEREQERYNENSQTNRHAYEKGDTHNTSTNIFIYKQEGRECRDIQTDRPSEIQKDRQTVRGDRQTDWETN